MTEVNNLNDITQQSNANNADTNQNNQNNQNQQNGNTSGSKQLVLGCDINQDDANYQQGVATVLEQAGYQVEKLAIEPNAFASYSDGSNGKDPKGKIGIYLIAAGTYSIADATYGTSKFDYNYFGIRPEPVSPGWKCSDFDTKPIGADGDCPQELCAKIAGKSFKEINEIVKAKSWVVTGENAEEMGKNLVAALGGHTSGSATGGVGGGAVLIPDKTFYGLIQQMMGAVDATFIIANNMAYLLSFKDIYEYRNQFDELIPKIERKHVLKDSVKKNWSPEGFYNAVEVTYADGTVKYQNDNLVKQHGENVFYYEFPEDDEETAKAKADALLSAHIRDYSTDVELSIFYNERITEGSWVKVHKTITQISGKTRKEILQDELKKKNKKAVSSKHKGITIENIVEKTIKGDDGKEKKIQSIKDAEGEKFDIEIEESEYELFFVQGYTCRWDKDNAALIMDLYLKYGPDTPQDPINATVGTGGGTTGAASAVGGQAPDITAFVKQCLGNSATQDMNTVKKLYDCLCQHIVYHYYTCSDYTTASECYQYAHGGGKHSEGINCADTSRLVVAAYKAAGFSCQVVSCDGHYWNEVTVGGQIQTVDCSSGQTGQHCTHELGHRLLADVPKSGEHGDNPSC